MQIFMKMYTRRHLDKSSESIPIFIFRNQEFEEAINFFTWALNINPCFLDAYTGRGNSYMEYGHDEATKLAQKDFLRALHFNPTYTKARISLGYNLQVILYKNILNAPSGQEKGYIWPFAGDGDTCYFFA